MRSVFTFCLLALISISFTIITQLAASTPAIKDAGNSIAELRKVNLNGRTEWISLRGKDKTKPLMLFLAGGPGGSQMAAVRYDLSKLEEDFVVVNWDQPGSGKSYSAAKLSDITPETYIEDGYALTMYLLKEFKQEKLYSCRRVLGQRSGHLPA